jgi:hypothetical protein
LAIPEDNLASLDNETMQRVYALLYSQSPDEEEEEALRDPRLLPLYINLINGQGSPPFATDLPLDPETAAEIVRYAVHLVGELATPDNQAAIAVLIGGLGHEKDRVKVGAAIALGKLKAQSAVELLVALLDNMAQKNDLGGLMRLAQALGKIGDERGKARLQQFVTERQGAIDEQTKIVLAEVEKAIRAIDEAIA